MKRYAAWFLLTLVSTITLAQTPVYCNAGFRPDGYIDFSGLPAAPAFPTGPDSVSAPITVTLPVTGVGGLTVQLTIPALQGGNSSTVYSVINGTLALGGLPANSQVLSLQFNNPVTGVGVIAGSSGRGFGFSLQTSPTDGDNPIDFQNAVNNFTLAPNFFSVPLQQVSLGAGFSTAIVQFSGGGFFPPSLSNLRVQSLGASTSYANMIPREGLQQWLSSDSVVSQFDAGAPLWPDQSGNGHDATQTVEANQPGQIQEDGNACKGVFAFSGNQYFNFNLPISGWDQMTIFLVGQSSVNPPSSSGLSQASAMFWNENASWGTTFLSPYQTSVDFRFGTGQAGNRPVYKRPVTVGQDFTITRAVHDGSTDSLYVDGLMALSQSNKSAVLNGTTGAGYIGRGRNNSYFHGEISEILVYNRALSTEEAASVESYLRNKFGTR